MEIITQMKTSVVPPIQKTDYVVGSDLLTNLHKIPIVKKKNYSTFLLLSDETVFNLYGKQVVASLRKLKRPVIVSVLPPGEKYKNIISLPKIIKPYFQNRFNRNACLVSLGGGVVTDLGGFLSSLLLRGIASIHIPTTLLAQIDAAIGGKTGVDLWLSDDLMYKNMIGTFKQPDFVISDVKTLSSLPKKEILNGLGEMVKYFIGWGKPNLRHLGWCANALLRGGGTNKAPRTPRGWPSQTWTPPMVKESEMANIISNCQKIKIGTIEDDPYDTLGIREKLNLGHTIGHTIEGVSCGKFSHGEAVAIGLVAATKISLLKGLLKKHIYNLIIKTIQQIGLPINARGIDKKKVLSVLKLDKKGGTFVLIRDIGDLEPRVFVEERFINTALSEVVI